MNRCAAFILGFLITAPMKSQAVVTIGDRSCGVWVDARRSEVINATASLDSLVVGAYLTGFMTGMAVDSRDDILRGTDYDSILLWMDKYCKAHPLEKISYGGIELFFELKSRMSKP